MWQGWIDLITGLWVLSCGFSNHLRIAPNLWISGLIIFVSGFWVTVKGKSWQGFINSLAGLWLFLSGLFFSIIAGWNFIIFGALITVLALWNVSAYPNNSAVQQA